MPGIGNLASLHKASEVTDFGGEPTTASLLNQHNS